MSVCTLSDCCSATHFELVYRGCVLPYFVFGLVLRILAVVLVAIVYIFRLAEHGVLITSPASA